MSKFTLAAAVIAALVTQAHAQPANEPSAPNSDALGYQALVGPRASDTTALNRYVNGSRQVFVWGQWYDAPNK